MNRKTAEFIRLFEASGWTQAEVARKLHITRGAVSQLCSGQTRPHERTLDLFRIALSRIKPEVPGMFDPGRFLDLPAWVVDLIEALRKLSEKDRECVLKPIQQIITALHLAGGRTGKS
jgi:transcriptional regulator with XRE-family HTH domain